MENIAAVNLVLSKWHANAISWSSLKNSCQISRIHRFYDRSLRTLWLACGRKIFELPEPPFPNHQLPRPSSLKIKSVLYDLVFFLSRKIVSLILLHFSKNFTVEQLFWNFSMIGKNLKLDWRNDFWQFWFLKVEWYHQLCVG